VLTLSIFGAAACKSTSKEPAPVETTAKASESAAPRATHAEITDEITTKAIVSSVDKATRVVTLRREDGKMFPVECGPEVRNFDQIAVGDTLRVRYRETLAATVRPAGETTTAVEGAFAAGRAKKGEAPAAGLGIVASARVKIESIDAANHIVVFSLAGGELNTVRAARPEGREFIKGLKIGDIVQIDYAMSMALAVEKM
jgi:hypothetical protein